MHFVLIQEQTLKPLQSLQNSFGLEFVLGGTEDIFSHHSPKEPERSLEVSAFNTAHKLQRLLGLAFPMGLLGNLDSQSCLSNEHTHLRSNVVGRATEGGRHLAPLSIGILQARILEWVAMPTQRSNPGNVGIKTCPLILRLLV